MTKVVLEINCGDSNPLILAEKPPVFGDYFRPPVFTKYSPGF